MSIIPAYRLSSSDLAILGNNIDPAQRRSQPPLERRHRRQELAAINRSLASVGEKVGTLQRPLLTVS